MPVFPVVERSSFRYRGIVLCVLVYLCVSLRGEAEYGPHSLNGRRGWRVWAEGTWRCSFILGRHAAAVAVPRPNGLSTASLVTELRYTACILDRAALYHPPSLSFPGPTPLFGDAPLQDPRHPSNRQKLLRHNNKMEQEHGPQWRKVMEDEDAEEGAAEKVMG